jgi:type III secretion protein D
MQTKSTIEMFVLTGEQAGARRHLDDNTTFTISGKMDTDVVFRDSSINEERLNLITKNNEVYIQVLNGDIEVQGEKISSGNLVKVPEYTKIKIGETTFAFGRELNATWREIVDYVSKIELTSARAKKFSQGFKRNQRMFVLVAFFLITAIFISLYFNRTVNNVDDINIANIENIQNILVQNGFESLAVAKSDTGQYVISGFLMTNRERSIIEKIIDEHKIPALLDLSTGDYLATEVRELLRVNGIEAEVKALKYGTVIISTELENQKKLEKLKQIAINEIPSLSELETEYIKSENTAQTIWPDTVYNKKDKRITMVVDGVPAYLMTSDKSKYYVGAILPTGHKIISIAKKQVVLEKEGQLTTLDF